MKTRPVALAARRRMVTGLAVLACAALAACASGGPGGDPALGTTQLLLDEPALSRPRGYLLHPPSGGVSEAALPLVVALHGASSTAAAFEETSGLSALADRERFVVVYPESSGVGPARLWNAGFCCGKPAERKIDDVGFVRRVVEDVAERLPVDRQRVYLVGYSNGGMLAYRYAAEHPTDLAALAVVAGAVGGRRQGDRVDATIPQAQRPLPVLVVHGLDDRAVPYLGGRGGRGMRYLAVSEAVEYWRHVNRSPLVPKLAEERSGQVQVRRFGGEGPVLLYTLGGWGHDWPGPRFTDRLPAGAPLRGFDVATVIWDFLRPHRRVVATD